tara:strand:+ start:164 stop:358 length:195 start_codon:yes stop_codon:yes gene_type:complete
MIIMDNRPLTDAEKNEIAELAADKAYERFYSAVGESIVKKALWVLGAGAMAAWYLISQGGVPKG